MVNSNCCCCCRGGCYDNRMSDKIQKTLTQFLVQQQEETSKQQADFMVQLTEKLQCLSLRVENSESSEELDVESLGNGITEFQYDAETGETFKAWYKRYASLFDDEAAEMSEEAKVKLLLRKLSTQCHQQYIDYILPKQPKEFSFKDTIKELTSMFEINISLSNTSVQCMDLAKTPPQDFVSLTKDVNKHCDDFKLTADQLKCLIFKIFFLTSFGIYLCFYLWFRVIDLSTDF